jgi:hypothetical protein
MAGWLAGKVDVSVSLARKQQSSRVRGCGGGGSGRVGQGETRQVNLTAGRQAGEQTDTRDRFLAVHSSQVLGKV